MLAVSEAWSHRLEDVFTSGPALIIAAHPDDEVIGVGGILSRFSDPYLVYVTDGAPRRTPNREEYALTRRKETERCLAMAGVSSHRALSLCAIDQETAFDLGALTRSLAALITRLGPRVIFTHPYEGGHPDHDSSAFITQKAVKLLQASRVQPPLVYEFTSYHNGSPHSDEPAMRVGQFLPASSAPVESIVLPPEAQKRKQQMFSCHESQREMLSRFSVAVERIRVAPEYDFAIPPHDGKLLYEYFDWGVVGVQWRRLARRAIEDLHLD